MTPELKQAIKKLQESGMTEAEISTALSLHIHRVRMVTNREWAFERRQMAVRQRADEAAQRGILAQQQAEAVEVARERAVAASRVQTGTTASGIAFQRRNGVSLPVITAQVRDDG